MKLTGALRMGTEGPPELTQFLCEQEMWQRFGAAGKPREAWAHLKVRAPLGIIAAMRREGQARARAR